MWGLGFWTRLQRRQEAFESKHILLSFLCYFFFFPFRVLITGSLRTAARHILPRLPFAWKTNSGVTSPPLSFNVTFYKERPRAKEIRWGHGCFAGLQIVCRKVEFVAN